MKSLILIFLFTLFNLTSFSFDGQYDLSPSKMKKVTSEILELFKSGKSGELKKYISEEWLDNKNINLKKYKINNYSPEHYEVIFAESDICVATLGSKGWEHLLAFKFVNEYGTYRVIPKGISVAENSYIDPLVVC